MEKQASLHQPLLTSSKTELVVERILEYLDREDVSTGHEIPKEIELAANLGVSRTIIREALSHLKLLGLIDSRKKRGMVFTEPKMVPTLAKILIPKLLEDKTRQEVFELRLMLELGIADTLFQKIKSQDILELGQIIAQEPLLMVSEKNPMVIEKLIKIDTEFHAQLYKITGNTILQSLQEVFLPTIKHVIAFQFDIDPLSYGQVSHHQLLETLKSGTPEDFRMGMRNHLSVHFDQLFHLKNGHNSSPNIDNTND